jgi:Domain of unknown function (DUF3067)
MMRASFGLLITLALRRLVLPVAGFELQPLWVRRVPPLVLAAELESSDEASQGSEEVDDFSLEAFQKAKEQIVAEEEEEFDGYAFRDIIYAKWGNCYDVDFNRVESFGFKKVYLNIYPFYLGRKPFRHATEYDYLCHLQAVVEILQQYGQLDYVLYQIGETKKRPIPGRSPLVAVPCRLDLTEEQVNSILGGK